MDALTVLLFVGGLVGSALRSLISTSQPTWSRKSLVDIITGGLIGILYPLFPVFPFPPEATILQKGALVAVLAYAGGDFIQNALRQIGVLTKTEGTT